MKTVYVGFKFSHMGPHAGYDLIKKHGEYDIFIDCQTDYKFQQKLYAKKNIISKIHGRLFGGYMWWVELRCLMTALFNRGLIFHFIYAENTYRYLGFFKWLGFKIVCTYHQPDTFFKSCPQYLAGIRFVDDVIVLSEEARSTFTDTLDPQRVHFLPHGVDCEYFQPDQAAPIKKQVLMVGNWLRNFKFAAQVFDQLLKIDPEINIHIVTLEINHKYFTKHSRLFLYTGISDQELLFRYQAASLLFLPLDGFVANNAVLEMSALGSPVLIASNQRPEENFERLIEHVPFNFDLTISKIMEMLHDITPKDIKKRNWVIKNYSWPVIGKQTSNIVAKSDN